MAPKYTLSETKEQNSLLLVKGGVQTKIAFFIGLSLMFLSASFAAGCIADNSLLCWSLYVLSAV
jgi:hypothetical protein